MHTITTTSLLLLGAALVNAGTQATLTSCLNSAIGNPDLVWKSSGSSNYTLNATGAKLFRTRSPLGILFAKTPAHVASAVTCCVNNQFRPVPRSGGHSYESLSSLNDALVIDLSTMNSIVIDDASLTATVSPGVRLGNLYNALYQRNPSYSYSSGTCPNVGLGGHMSAGGYGMLARKKGLAVDNAISAKMVLVNGTTVTVSPTLNTDLWFAIRGGGGGSYGIVVEWKLKIQVVPYHYIAHVRYSNLAQFPAILAKYLSWTQTGLASKTNTGTVSYNGWDISLQFQIDPSQIQLLVHYAPDSASSPATLDAILTAAGMVNTGSFSWSYIHQPIQVTTIQAHSFFAQAYTTSDATALSTVSAPAYHTDGNYKELASMKSDYLATMPSSTTNLATAITNSMSACKSSNPYDYCFVQFESYGGQVAAAGSTSNAAFPHRNVLASMQYAIIFTKPSSTDARNKGTTWINNLQSALAPYVSGGKYQGYVDLDVADPSKYYGGNYGTLQATKAKYDPNNVFWSDLVRPASTSTIWFGSSYVH